MPLETLVRMNDSTSGNRPWFAIHSIEGVVVPLETVMTQVNSDVYGLQCTEQAPMGSMSVLAAFYIEVRQRRLNQ